MKILFVCNDLEYFLAHRVFLAKDLAARGHAVHVSSGIYENVDIDKELENITFHPVDVEKHRLAPSRDWRLFRQLTELLKTQEFDVVHTLTIKPNLFVSLALVAASITNRSLVRPGFVMTFPGLGKVYEPTKSIMATARRAFISGVLSLTRRKLNPIATFENQETREQLVEYGIVERERSRVMLGAGINRESFYPSEKTGKPRVLYAGRLLRAKGIETFVSAAASIRTQYPDAEFLVAGAIETKNPDAIKPALLEKAAINNHITYLNFINIKNMPDLLRTIDILCVPTRLKEGFPRVILEAAACGCAVISTHQKVVEQIVEEGETGWFIDPPNVQQLKEKLVVALDDIARTRKMGQVSANRVLDMPVYETDILDQTRSIYKELMEERQAD